MTPYVPPQVLMKLVGSCLPRNPLEPIPPMKHALFQHAKRVVITANYIIGHSHYRTKLPCCHLLTMDGYGMKDWNPGCLIGAICLKSARHVLYWSAAIKDASTESVGVQEMLWCALLFGLANMSQQWTVEWLSYAFWRTMKYHYYNVCKTNPLCKFYAIQKLFCMIFFLKIVACIMQT